MSPPKQHRIIISPDGKVIQGLYSDAFGWEALGELSIRRATDITFDSETQRWMISILDESGRILDQGHIKRSDAIQAEIEYINHR